jgi:hypothetical protein
MRGVVGRRATDFLRLQVGSSPRYRAGLQLWHGGSEDLRAVAVQRGINPFCVDDALGGLSLGAVRNHLPIPAFGIQRTRRP